MKYASETSVPVERSKAEIERILRRYGATGFLFGTSPGQAIIGFQTPKHRVRFNVPLPSLGDFERTTRGRRRRSKAEALRHFDKGTRQVWRAIALVLKAKLEATESGISTFEEEFLAWLLLPGGVTVGERILPEIGEIYERGLPPLLPEPKKP